MMAGTLLRAGHAPHDLREAFAGALYLFMQSKVGDPLQPVDLQGMQVDLVKLTGLLWNCRDIAPRTTCQEVSAVADRHQLTDLHHGGKTYAQCARLLRGHLSLEATR